MVVPVKGVEQCEQPPGVWRSPWCGGQSLVGVVSAARSLGQAEDLAVTCDDTNDELRGSLSFGDNLGGDGAGEEPHCPR